jgi:hypothetical protein
MDYLVVRRSNVWMLSKMDLGQAQNIAELRVMHTFVKLNVSFATLRSNSFSRLEARQDRAFEQQRGWS